MGRERVILVFASGEDLSELLSLGKELARVFTSHHHDKGCHWRGRAHERNLVRWEMRVAKPQV